MNETKSNLPKWIAAALVIGAFLLADFLTPLAFNSDSDWPTMIVVGVCIAQINLTAVWAAMAPGNVVVRLPWTVMLSVFMWYALVLGNRFAWRQDYINGYRYACSLDEVMRLGVILLFSVIAAQIPLWIASRVYRWRLVGWIDKREAADGRLRFHIWHMMLGTAFVALTLSPAKMILPPGKMEDLYLEDLFYTLPIEVTVCNLLITIPCVWIAFWRKKLLPAAVTGWLVCIGLMTGVEFAAYCVLVGELSSLGVYFLFYLMNVTQCVVVLGTLLIFRAVGLRLVRLPRGGPAPDEFVEMNEANDPTTAPIA